MDKNCGETPWDSEGIGGRSLRETIKRAWQLAKYNYGNGHDWFVEYDGRVVGILNDQHFVEMFWDECCIEEIDPIVRDEDLWNNCQFKFRSSVINEYAYFAFAGWGAPFIRNGRMSMRGLYLSARNDIERHLARWFGWGCSLRKLLLARR
jgi:hypothetical protein